jgi:DNA gyrase subunit A
MVNRTHVAELRPMGRNTQGVRIMNLKEGDKIASIAKVAREEDEAGEAPDSPEPDAGQAPEEPAAE